ncbi:ribonuclease HII [Sphingosinicella soli]|uniref:Ribonuclease HII n=1 Tax=Sphingosinicella soli TaxID=333708 RepID=A0A7W7B172_9SPHN|nr:ribonuclease HII [Sphingosinicella soli]MBB4632158.1 ribonuclease HII [Sphingosinicella soli]
MPGKLKHAGPDYSHEARCAGRVAGVDEAGRGPLAGPVVAAAVIFDPGCIPDGLNDSKKLTHGRREALFDIITGCAQVGIGEASPEEIDSINILQATFLAMTRAVAALPAPPDHVLVDGNRSPRWSYRCDTIVGGDGRCVSIAAASIIAKVTRDRHMMRLHADFPGYGWQQNKGYPTRAHLEAVTRFGITVHHRLSFGPVQREREFAR